MNPKLTEVALQFKYYKDSFSLPNFPSTETCTPKQSLTFWMHLCWFSHAVSLTSEINLLSLQTLACCCQSECLILDKTLNQELMERLPKDGRKKKLVYWKELSKAYFMISLRCWANQAQLFNETRISSWLYINGCHLRKSTLCIYSWWLAGKYKYLFVFCTHSCILI